MYPSRHRQIVLLDQNNTGPGEVNLNALKHHHPIVVVSPSSQRYVHVHVACGGGSRSLKTINMYNRKSATYALQPEIEPMLIERFDVCLMLLICLK